MKGARKDSGDCGRLGFSCFFGGWLLNLSGFGSPFSSIFIELRGI